MSAVDLFKHISGSFANHGSSRRFMARADGSNAEVVASIPQVAGADVSAANPLPVELTNLPATQPVSATALPLPAGASTAGNQASIISTLAAILSATETQRAETIWTDDSGAYYVRIDNGGTLAWTTPAGAASTGPGTGARPSATVEITVDGTRYQATAAGTGFAVGDYLNHVVTIDPSTGATIANFWLNATAATTLSSPPSSASITPLAPLPAGAATAVYQAAANALLASLIAALGSPLQTGGAVSLSASTITGDTTANSTSLKALAQAFTGAHALHGWDFQNPNSSTVYVQVFDALIANVTLGTTTPKLVKAIPASGWWEEKFAFDGIAFANGLALAVTTTPTGSTAPTSALIFNANYR